MDVYTHLISTQIVHLSFVHLPHRCIITVINYCSFSASVVMERNSLPGFGIRHILLEMWGWRMHGYIRPSSKSNKTELLLLLKL